MIVFANPVPELEIVVCFCCKEMNEFINILKHLVLREIYILILAALAVATIIKLQT